MNTVQLTISFEDYATRTKQDILITASNMFMLIIKFYKFYTVNTYIHGWYITTQNWNAGTPEHEMNAVPLLMELFRDHES